MLGFDRQITAGDTVKWYQIERAVAMSGDIKPFNGVYRLINFRKLIVDYVLFKCWEKKGEDKRSDKCWNRYLYGLQRMKELLNIDMDNAYNIVMEDHPARFYRRKRFPQY